jgi:hypothetical protein
MLGDLLPFSDLYDNPFLPEGGGSAVSWQATDRGKASYDAPNVHPSARIRRAENSVGITDPTDNWKPRKVGLWPNPPAGGGSFGFAALGTRSA